MDHELRGYDYCQALALIWWLFAQHAALEQALTVAGLGFLTRDVAIFVFFAATRRRGDFVALVTFLALYALIPAILNGLGLAVALPLFYPTPSDPVWLGPAIVWGKAAMAVTLPSAVSRWRKSARLSAFTMFEPGIIRLVDGDLVQDC